MATIGYERAKNMMSQLDWKLRVTTQPVNQGGEVEKFELFHPKQKNTYTVRKDSGSKLLRECSVIGRESDVTAILCYARNGITGI